MNAVKNQPTRLESVAPTVLGTLGLLVTLVAVSTVWLFLANPAGVATAATSGGFAPLVRAIVDALVQVIDTLLRHL